MAGSVAVTLHKKTDEIVIEKHAFVADAAAATFVASSVKAREGWGIAWVTTDPGATAPTANYDGVINNDVGGDVMGGALANRAAAATENAVPLAGTTPWTPPLYCDHSIALSNNAVNSAVVDVYVGLIPFPPR